MIFECYVISGFQVARRLVEVYLTQFYMPFISKKGRTRPWMVVDDEADHTRSAFGEPDKWPIMLSSGTMNTTGPVLRRPALIARGLTV